MLASSIYSARHARDDAAPMRDRLVSTGELRGALQPVRFLYLAGPATTTAGASVFAEGDHVAAQYWGNGIVRLTMVNSHISYPVLAHSIRSFEPSSIKLDYEGQVG